MIDWFDLLAVQVTLKSFLQHTTVQKYNYFVLSILYGPAVTSVHDFWKNHSFDCMDLCWQSDVFAFKTLSRLVIVFLPRSKCLLISWLQEICHCFHFFPFYLPWTNGAGCMILVFWMLSFKPAFSLSFSPSSRGSLIPLHFLLLEWYHPHICCCWCFSCLSCNSSSPAFLIVCLAYRLNRMTADSSVILLSRSWTNQLFHRGF